MYVYTCTNEYVCFVCVYVCVFCMDLYVNYVKSQVTDHVDL